MRQNLMDYLLDSIHAIRNLADCAFDNRFTLMIENPVAHYKLESRIVFGLLILPLASD